MDLEFLFEKHATTLEKMGMSPVAARVMIYLLTQDDNGKEFDEIVSDLKVSKSAVSNSLKLLENLSVVKYVSISTTGKRRFYLSGVNDVSEYGYTERHEHVIALLDDVIRQRDPDSVFTRKLKEFKLFHEMMIEAYFSVVEKWRKIIEQV